MVYLDPETRSAGPAVGHPRVGEPYTPSNLEALGLTNRVPDIQPELPGGPWRRMYRIWSSQGWIGIHNRNAGVLSIARGANRPDRTFLLTVVQKLAYKGGILQTIAAQAICNLDELATLREWSVTSTITDTSGRVEPMLSLYAAYSVDDKILSRTSWNQPPGAADAGAASADAGSAAAGHHPHKTVQIEPPITSDFGLFEAVARLPLRRPSDGMYTSMDGLTVVKPRRQLCYRRDRVERLDEQELELHGFYQIGLGALPYEYWVDRNHRVVMMISMNRVYFLDDDAERILEENLSALRSTGDYIERN